MVSYRKPGYHARAGRTHEAKAWYEPVKEKKAGVGRGNWQKGARRRKKAVKQYKLFSFFDKHFGGNISNVARAIGFNQPKLFKIIDRGTLKRENIDRIVMFCQMFDPEIKEEDLFIPHQYVDVPVKISRKREISDPGIPIIRPVLSSTVRTVTDSAFSAALARVS